MSDPTDCRHCGHPAEHHDDGTECWTNGEGEQVWDDVPDKCVCGWYDPVGEGSE